MSRTKVVALVAITVATQPATAAIIDDVSFFTGIPHTLIDWETNGNGNAVLLANGSETPMADDEYAALGFRFTESTAPMWTNPAGFSTDTVQIIGGSPANFLGYSLFGDDISTEFVIEFLQPVHAFGFWMQLGNTVPTTVFEAQDSLGNSLGSVGFTGDIIDGTFNDFINYGFMGIASDTEIARVVLTEGFENGIFLDDLRFSSIPAPASGAVLSLGGIMALRRRRDR